MTTFTLELPDSLARQLKALPKTEVNAFAVKTFPELIAGKRELPAFPASLSRADLSAEEAAAIEEGLADVEAGRVTDGVTFLAEMKSHLAGLKTQGAAEK